MTTGRTSTSTASVSTSSVPPTCSGKRWSTLIVSAMLAGATRFSDIRDEVAPISDTLLSERLKQLEADGIVRRDVTPSTPVLIEYHLTDEGRDLERVIDELRSWAERWAETPVAHLIRPRLRPRPAA